MGIQEDAGELLLFLYQEFMKPNIRSVSKDSLERETGWEEHRLIKSVEYLTESGYIRTHWDRRRDFHISRLYPLAINTIEDESRFKDSFCIEVGLPGIFKFSWKREER